MDGNAERKPVTERAIHLATRSGRVPRFEKKSFWRPELFHDQRARMRSLPPEYASAWVQHISDVMDRDELARYLCFAFWTKAYWGGGFGQIGQPVQTACQFMTCDLFLSIPHSSRNRPPVALAVAAIVLPARREEGVLHVHGFFRIPVEALKRPTAPISVETQGGSGLIEAPEAIARVVLRLRSFAHGQVMSLNIAHEDGHATDFTGDRAARTGMLGYLEQGGGETRHWDEAQRLPGRHWSRITKQWNRSGISPADCRMVTIVTTAKLRLAVAAAVTAI